MSNYEDHVIGLYQDDIDSVKEFLKIAINTIFFHRWINNKNYNCESSAIKDISFMKIKDNTLDEKIGKILDQLSYDSKTYNKFQMIIEFYKYNQGGFLGWFQKKTLWERWNILIIIKEEGSTDKEDNMRRLITMILQNLNNNIDFMPEIELEGFENMDMDDNDKGNKNDSDFPFELKLVKHFEQASYIKLFETKNFNKIEE